MDKVKLPVNKRYHIYELSQIGNIGPHEIQRYSPRASGAVKQPSTGFATLLEAESFIQDYNVKTVYGWEQLTILAIYTKNEII